MGDEIHNAREPLKPNIKKMIHSLINKFNAKSKAHLFVIFLVFGLSGSFSLWF